ncbi:MAG: prepilin-type N-terminal cleavage/methylation domain-containing protein [Myxococcales bacterium]|nr:prepilin-type N-terminal cleavage/methylation domain-containing protein [Myxococcales bacterium]
MNRRGFTLLEVVVAIGILAMIGMLTLETLSSALDTRDVLEEEDAANQSARVALDRLRRDLRLAYLTENTSAVNTYRTQFIGKNDDPDQLWFTTLSHHRMYRESRECDQTEVTYWTEDDPTMDGAKVLLRREAPRIDHEPENDGLISPLAYHLKDINYRYINPKTNTWLDEWDSTGVDTANSLPRAVQIALVFLVPDPEEEGRLVERPYATTVLLHYADRLTLASSTSTEDNN